MANVINQATVDLIKRFEGLGDGDKVAPGYQPYICPAGYWTIGYGRVVRGPDGQMYKGEVDRRAANAVYPDGITADQASVFLAEDLAAFGKKVAAKVTAPLTDNQFGACTSFAYNVGVGSFSSSTLLKKLNAGDYQGAADQFLLWDKATDRKTGKKVALPGLTKRRQAERALFLQA